MKDNKRIKFTSSEPIKDIEIESDHQEITEYWNNSLPDCKISKNGELSIKKLLLTFNKDEIKKAINISIATYVFYDKDETLNFDSALIAFDKLSGICNCLKDETLGKAYYIRGILKNRFYISKYMYSRIVPITLAVVENGYTIESIESIAKNCRSFNEWLEIMNE